MGVSSTKFEFEGDSSKAMAELRKLADQNRALELQLQKMMQTAEKGNKAVIDSLQRQTKEVKSLTGENSKLKTELDKVKDKYKEVQTSQKTMGDAGARVFGVLKGAAGAAGLLLSMQQIITVQREYNRELDRTALAQDKVGRMVQVQALMKDEQFKKRLERNIAPIGMRYAVGLPEIQGVVTELLNQGVSTDEAMGGVLEEVIALARGTGSQDINSVARGAVGFLRSSGKDVNAKNVRSLSAPLAGLFRERPIQSADIEELGSIGALLKEANINQTEALAAFTVLRTEGNLKAPEAVTGVRNMALRLATMGADKKKVAILNQLGGEGFAEKIDLVGESFPQALTNLSDALNAMKNPGDRLKVLGELFDSYTAAPAATLLSEHGMKQMFGNMRIQATGGDALQKGVDVATRGRAAQQTRLGIQQQMGELGRAQNLESQTGGVGSEAYFEGLKAVQARRGNFAIFDWVDMKMSELSEMMPAPVAEFLRNPDAVDRAKNAARAATIREMATDIPGETPITHETISGGRVIDLLPKKKVKPVDALDAKIAEADLNAARAQLELDKLRVQIEDPNSPMGKRHSIDETRNLDAMTQTVRALNNLTDELKLQREEKKLAETQAKAAQPTNRKAQK